MPTYTPNFNFALPLVNNPVDANVWGGYLNGDLTSLDSILLDIDSSNIGPSQPTNPGPVAGQFWINNSISNSWPVQIYDGTTWVSIGIINPITHSFTAFGSIGFLNIQTFTNSGTYFPTPGVTFIEVEICGGGGGGGCVLTDGVLGHKCAGAGGGAGNYAKGFFTLAQIGVSQGIAIGTGGAGASNAIVAGATGGTSSFGAFMSVPGGLGGGSTQPGFLNNQCGLTQGGYSSGTGAGGYLNCPGGAGSPGITLFGLSGGNVISGTGGMSFFGGGGNGFANVGIGPTEGNGTNATSYGSGGGGALLNNSASNWSGGNGAAGICFITEYGL